MWFLLILYTWHMPGGRDIPEPHVYSYQSRDECLYWGNAMRLNNPGFVTVTYTCQQ